MKIMEVSETDVKQLKEIAESAMMVSVLATSEEKKILLESIKSDIDKYIMSDNCIYLKLEDNEIKGYILIKEFWNLAHLFVSPKFQGYGFGTKLLQEGIKVCKENNSNSFIRVNSSHNALGFYKKMGFIEHAPEKSVPNFAVPLIYNF